MALIDIVVFAAGFAACWYGKDFLLKTFKGATAFATQLEAKAAAIKAAVK